MKVFLSVFSRLLLSPLSSNAFPAEVFICPCCGYAVCGGTLVLDCYEMTFVKCQLDKVNAAKIARYTLDS